MNHPIDGYLPMKNKAIRYDAAFKENVLSQLRSGQSARHVAQEMGIPPLTLKRWQVEDALLNLPGVSGLPEQSIADELQRRIFRLEEEKRVLKEALHILLRASENG